MPNKRWFWAAVALQILILLGLIGTHLYTRFTGAPVLLRTLPVDPWDLFRGEYVALRYEISELSPEQVPMTGIPYRRGQTVWVTLRKGDPFWTAVAVSPERPATGPDEIALRGTVEWYAEAWVNGPEAQPARTFIRYGIEQFYVPEGEGARLQQQPHLTVEALVDRFGRAALHRVFLDGSEIRWR
jgi:uncharacterized membrane-anchored protein